MEPCISAVYLGPDRIARDNRWHVYAARWEIRSPVATLTYPRAVALHLYAYLRAIALQLTGLPASYSENGGQGTREVTRERPRNERRHG